MLEGGAKVDDQDAAITGQYAVDWILEYLRARAISQKMMGHCLIIYIGQAGFINVVRV